MINPSISGGLKNLAVAYCKSQIVKTQMNMILTNVPRISALWYPNDFIFDAGLYASVSETIEIANPTTSDSKWAVSVNIAIDPDKMPPVV